MCGIFCSLSHHGYIVPDASTQQLLSNRGPDSTCQHQALLHTTQTNTAAQLHATFLSTVLSLRGETIVTQPLQDAHTASVLCWNGEAWSIGGDLVAGNDSQAVFDKLLKASAETTSPNAAMGAIIGMLSSIRGPYAFVFYDARHNLLYYARDCLGRRSLLRKNTVDGSLVLSSVCDNNSGHAWTEVEADGVYVVDLDASSPDHSLPSPRLIPHRRSNQAEDELCFVGKCLQFKLLLITIDIAISCHEHHSLGSVTGPTR